MTAAGERPGGLVFADESKAGDYLLAATRLGQTEVARVTRVMRGLVLPGQRRVHMAKESPARRRQILKAISNAGVHTTIYDAGRRHHSELAARAACLTRLVTDTDRAALLTLERDDSLADWDRRLLFSLTRGRPGLRYQHERAAEQPLLWIPDAIAWAWARGGDWRRQVNPTLVTFSDC